jgi:hypothetical protein
MAHEKDQATQTMVGERWMQRVLNLSRIKRILFVGGVALLTGVVAQPVVDAVYLNFFYDPRTVVVPSIVTAIVVLIVYLIGWQLVVGTVGESKTPRPPVLWYLIGALLITITALLWIARLLLLHSAVPSA